MIKGKFSWLVAMALFFFFNFLLPSNAFSYQVSKKSNGADLKWSSSNVTYFINTSGSPAGSLPAIQAAMQTWTDVSSSSFVFNYGGPTTSTSHGIDDGLNLVNFAPMGRTGTLAENMYWYDSSGMTDSDIQFNTSYTWATDGSAGPYDVQNIGTHELGHSLSLDDLYGSGDTEKTMYGYASAGETKKRTLDQDDIDGISYLYPVATLPAPGTVSASNTQYNTFVDSPFDLTTTFTDNDSDVMGCEYIVNGAQWTAATVSGTRPTFTCSKTGLTGTNGQSLTLNMRATSSGGTGTATAITRVVDTSAPTTSDNQTSGNWQSSEKTITLTPNDGAGSGVAASTGIYGCFGIGCTPVLRGGSTMTTACGAGNECAYDVRYYSKDNVGNTESTRTSFYQARVDRKPPSSGATFAATSGDAQCSLSWSTATDSGSGMHSTQAYEVRYQAGSAPGSCALGTQLYLGTGTNVINGSLTNGTTYYYRLCYKDNVGNQSQFIGNPITCSPVSLPLVNITATVPIAIEAVPTTGQFTVTRTGATTSALTVTFAVSGTATPGSDYNSIGASVTIPAASASALITVSPINGATIESGKTVIVTLSANAAYMVGSSGTATVTIVSEGAALSLNPGWNLITLPVSPLFPSYTAQSVLDEIKSQGGNCGEIDRWFSGAWDGHINGLPFNDFSMEMGKGYFLKCQSAGTLTIIGSTVSPLSIPLSAGWNLVGIPSGAYKAQDILDEIKSQGGNCVEIDRWFNGTWDGHIDSLPFNNYDKEGWRGYFLKCQTTGTWQMKP